MTCHTPSSEDPLVLQGITVHFRKLWQSTGLDQTIRAILLCTPSSVMAITTDRGPHPHHSTHSTHPTHPTHPSWIPRRPT